MDDTPEAQKSELSYPKLSKSLWTMAVSGTGFPGNYSFLVGVEDMSHAH